MRLSTLLAAFLLITSIPLLVYTEGAFNKFLPTRLQKPNPDSKAIQKRDSTNSIPIPEKELDATSKSSSPRSSASLTDSYEEDAGGAFSGDEERLGTSEDAIEDLDEHPATPETTPETPAAPLQDEFSELAKVVSSSKDFKLKSFVSKYFKLLSKAKIGGTQKTYSKIKDYRISPAVRGLGFNFDDKTSLQNKDDASAKRNLLAEVHADAVKKSLETSRRYDAENPDCMPLEPVFYEHSVAHKMRWNEILSSEQKFKSELEVLQKVLEKIIANPQINLDVPLNTIYENTLTKIKSILANSIKICEQFESIIDKSNKNEFDLQQNYIDEFYDNVYPDLQRYVNAHAAFVDIFGYSSLLLGAEDLNDFSRTAITPIQRSARYPLLFQDFKGYSTLPDIFYYLMTAGLAFDLNEYLRDNVFTQFPMTPEDKREAISDFSVTVKSILGKKKESLKNRWIVFSAWNMLFTDENMNANADLWPINLHLYDDVQKKVGDRYDITLSPLPEFSSTKLPTISFSVPSDYFPNFSEKLTRHREIMFPPEFTKL